MADVTASALIGWLKSHVGDGYVYGTVGETCTVALLQRKQRQYGASMGDGYYQKGGNYAKGLCAAWLGKWVADCSGLIKAGRKALSGVWRDVSAQGTYDQCSVRGGISTMPKIPGCTVYMWSNSKHRMGHVGVYIGNGQVIEARGVRYGVVVTKLSGRTWGYWGLPDWLDYDLNADNGGQSGGGGAEPDAGDATNPKPDDPPAGGMPQQEAQGDRGGAVKLLQQQLNVHHASPAVAIDGIFGPKTRAAVLAFQKSHGLAADGIVGPKTWAALVAAPTTAPTVPRTLNRGDSGADVERLQRLLLAGGFSPGKVDGLFGPRTESAVRAYQRAKGLAVDGIVGPKTWGKLLD